MKAKPAVHLAEDPRVPGWVHTLEAFRRWCQDDSFPEQGRIDYLEGNVEVDLSPEELYTHAAVKTTIAAELYSWFVKTDLGNVFSDRTRIVSPRAGLSAEPDVVVVLLSTIESGRVREVPSANNQDRIIELEGAPDLVVEIVSDSSVQKDRKHLPRAYAAAGIPEIWIVDARGRDLLFEVQLLGPSGYASQPRDPQGWAFSPLLDASCRLERRRNRLGRWAYELRTRGSDHELH